MEDKTKGTADLRHRLALWRTGRTCGKRLDGEAEVRQEAIDRQGFGLGGEADGFAGVKRTPRWKTGEVGRCFGMALRGEIKSGKWTALGRSERCSTWNISIVARIPDCSTWNKYGARTLRSLLITAKQPEPEYNSSALERRLAWNP